MRKSFLCLLLLAGTCSFAQKAESPLYEQTSEVNNLMVHYNADNVSITRFYVIRNSPERRERLRAMNEEYLSLLDKMDYDKLPVGSRRYRASNKDTEMGLFNLSYDLHAHKDYAGLEAGIKLVVKNWARPLKSTWLVEYDGSAEELQKAVAMFMDADDSLLVCEVKVASIAWKGLAKNLVDWIMEVYNRLRWLAA